MGEELFGWVRYQLWGRTEAELAELCQGSMRLGQWGGNSAKK